MEPVLVVALVVGAAAVAWLLASRRPAPVANSAVTPEAIELVMAIAREQLGSHTSAADASLANRQHLIDTKLGEVQSGVQADLGRLSALVQQLGDATTLRFGQVDNSLKVHSEITQVLAGTASSLREALASSNARGQWGERMAEDILRSAGMQEKINYVKRTAVDGDGKGIPDFTFMMPRGQVLFMDVKFPMASYLKYLEAGSDGERDAHRATFVRDVRSRVKELARREYAQTDDRPTVDTVLLFVPNESLAAFIHESDDTIIEYGMSENIVICSPLTLFAFLGVIRQAFDNFTIEQTSKEILGLLGKFDQQWKKYSEQVERVRKQFEGVNRAFDELATTRRRALEKPLDSIDVLRRRQALPIDGQLFGTDDELEFDNVHELGA